MPCICGAKQRWAHLLGDTLDELHVMATRLGIPRRAFQNKLSGAHDDVPAPLRAKAIALDTIPISRHTDRALLKALIAIARAQARSEGLWIRNREWGFARAGAVAWLAAC